jgi:putative ABC transport system ATP-binding protein
MELVRLHGVGKTFYAEPDALDAQAGVEVLRGIDLNIRSGEFVSLQGTSGSGKSTLLHIMGLLDRATAGQYLFDGQDVSAMDDDQLSGLRNSRIGFIFQSFHLVPYATALENVLLPGMYSNTPQSQLRPRAEELLQQVGLGDRLQFKPSKLSGGQQQRVAMARALLNAPDLILADEPTGQLDSRTSAEIMNLFCQVHAAGTAIVLVTHDAEVAGAASRIIRLDDGEIVEQKETLHE